MAEQKMSGKDLLAQLYRGLDTVPAAVEVAMDARNLRKLTPAQEADAWLLPPPSEEVAPKRPAARAKLVRSPLVMLCGLAVVGAALAAAALHDSYAPSAAPAAAAVAPPSPPPVQAASEPAPEEPKYVEVVNPFDATEVFRFPPGTSKAEARDQMAELLLKRAIARNAHVPRTRKLAAEQRAAAGGHGS
jgi:hypothetical protein